MSTEAVEVAVSNERLDVMAYIVTQASVYKVLGRQWDRETVVDLVTGIKDGAHVGAHEQARAMLRNATTQGEG